MSYARWMRFSPLALLVPVFLLACANDFSTYQPVADGGVVGDGSTTGDGSANPDGAKTDGAPVDGQAGDATCTPSSNCTNAANNCSDTCKNTRDDCVNACKNNPDAGSACQTACTTAETTCRAACVTTCVTCTTQAGCPGQNACNNAVN